MSALQRITARPHPTGSPASAELAQDLRQTLEGFGLEVRVHEYQVLHSKPRKVEMTMTSPAAPPHQPRRAAARRGIPTSSHPELGGGYVSYSASGTASGQIVYVNYGLPPDYAAARGSSAFR